MPEPRNYVTVSQRGSRWRVAAKRFSDWNSLDRTLAETMCNSEQAARKLAARWARDYDAEVL